MLSDGQVFANLFFFYFFFSVSARLCAKINFEGEDDVRQGRNWAHTSTYPHSLYPPILLPIRPPHTSPLLPPSPFNLPSGLVIQPDSGARTYSSTISAVEKAGLNTLNEGSQGEVSREGKPRAKRCDNLRVVNRLNLGRSGQAAAF